MASPRYELLRSRDLRAALTALGDIADAADDAIRFAEVGVQVLSRLVPSELASLSRCDLHSGKRSVIGVRPGSVGADERAAFDRHFYEHPLGRYHAAERGACAHRITDSMPQAHFVETALYNDYYRRVSLTHALALPLRMDGHEMASFVLNRQGRDFDPRELALLDVMRRPLQRLFEIADARQPRTPTLEGPTLARFQLTPREGEVLQWVAAGKTDADVALQLGCSPRTVHKHLQRVYVKLGVETRTAAVMRALSER